MFYFYKCGFYEKSINSNVLPSYHDGNTSISIFKFLIYTGLVVSVLFIQIFFISKCLEFLSKPSNANNQKGENQLFLFSSLFHGFKIRFESITFEYLPFVFVLCGCLVATAIMLFFDKDTFILKRNMYFNHIKFLFEKKFATHFNYYTQCAENFLNYYIEDITFGFYAILNNQIWFISIILGIYILMIIYTIRSLSREGETYSFVTGISNKLKEMFDLLEKDMRKFCIDYGLRLIMFAIPGIFFFIYYRNMQSFIKNQKKYANTKIMNHFLCSNNLQFKISELFDQNLIKEFIKSWEKYQNICIWIHVGALAKILHFKYDEEGNSIKFDELACFLIFPLFLLCETIFSEKLLLATDNMRHLSETIVKIQILEGMPINTLNSNNDKTNININNISVDGLKLIRNHTSGVSIECSNDINLKIHLNEKILLYYDHGILPDLFVQCITNIYEDNKSDVIFALTKDKIKYDIAKLGHNNLSQLIFISEKLRLYPNLTIYENFKKFIPNISKVDVDQALSLALLSDFNSNCIYKENFPKALRNKVLTALLFSFKDKSLICVNEDILSGYTQDELKEILNTINHLCCAVIMILKASKVPKFIFEKFDSVYRAHNKNISKINNFSQGD